MSVQSWSDVKNEELVGISGVCFDIDDTFSSGGKITAEAFNALWQLKQKGFVLVPVTGRPAGWCDHIARFWPVDAVVGENGAFTFFMQDGVRKRIDTPMALSTDEAQKKLSELQKEIAKEFPQAKWASDQNYREYDLAIDTCEDVPAWDQKEVKRLIALCHKRGAHAKLSSVHVNTWFGDYDKNKGFTHWLTASNTLKKQQWIYLGDSPNDEPMFESFDKSVGVANLNSFLSQLKNPPTWITQKESGAGFVEVAQRLVSL